MDHDHMDMMSPPPPMGGMDMSPPPPMAPMKKHYTSMTFFWGRKAEVLFSDWPGDRRGMYALALIVVFLLSAGTEMISNHRVDQFTKGIGLAQTAVHTLRVGLMYLLMLAVMSFNGGIFIAACLGHALGFLLFRSAFLRSKQREEEAGSREGGKYRDLPSMSC